MGLGGESLERQYIHSSFLWIAQNKVFGMGPHVKLVGLHVNHVGDSQMHVGGLSFS